MTTIGLYKLSPSIISSLIRWQTRSVYSHVAIKTHDGFVYEALASGFVKASSYAANHHNALVDILTFKDSLTAAQEADVKLVCERMIGSPYDYEMVLAGFPMRFHQESKSSRKKLFCSEAVFLACAAGQRLLLERIMPWEVSPEHINISPLLKWVDSIEV